METTNNCLSLFESVNVNLKKTKNGFKTLSDEWTFLLTLLNIELHVDCFLSVNSQPFMLLLNSEISLTFSDVDNGGWCRCFRFLFHCTCKLLHLSLTFIWRHFLYDHFCCCYYCVVSCKFNFIFLTYQVRFLLLMVDATFFVIPSRIVCCRRWLTLFVVVA